MIRFAASVVVLALLVIPLQSAEKVDQAKNAVIQQLAKYRAPAAQVTHIDDKAVTASLPGHHYFAVLYRLYPVARALPEPLKYANVMAVSADGKVSLLNEEKKLTEHFKSHLKQPADEDGLKNAARAWLRISQTLSQDGFYTFALMDDSTKVQTTAAGKAVSGTVVVMRGGSGTISATLQFNGKNELLKVSHKTALRRGVRPRCHATLLLDANPIVRAIAEQDLLIMGKAAKAYLQEQRQKAEPKLQKAIDRLWQRILEEER